MIIFEGLDATGKSTLAKYVAQRVHELRLMYLAVQGSEGPAKSIDEIHDRITRYRGLRATMFDRHPVISQGIYSIIHDNPILIGTDVIQAFYDQRNLYIYCDPPDTYVPQTTKPGEDPAFIARIHEHHWRLLDRYRKWAIHRAHVIYHIGMDMEIIVKIVANCLDRL